MIIEQELIDKIEKQYVKNKDLGKNYSKNIQIEIYTYPYDSSL